MMDGIVTVTLNAAIDQTLDCPGFTVGRVNRVTGQTLTAGGKGINVAAFLAAGLKGAPVTATGFLGTDNTPVFEVLFRERAISDRCLRLPGASRVNVKVVDCDGGTVTDINLPGLRVSDKALDTLRTTVEELAGANRYFVLAGSLPAGVPEEIYADLILRLKARGAFVAVDTSGLPLRHALAAEPDLMKPNVHELSELLSRPLNGRDAVLRAARDLRDGGIGMVVVSLGAEGAVFVDGKAALLAVPPAVEVASTVGAGDAMVAGIVAARVDGGDLEGCARRGTAFAVGTLARLGPELPPLEEIGTLMRAVRIERL
ncbi:MAG TPA: 1-phosphofructokinase [Azospirillaceae bacterium]|nr:1-phosphofructokinase [Azospirillaceae bacterium]